MLDFEFFLFQFVAISFIVYGVHLYGVNVQKILGAKLENLIIKHTKNSINGLAIGSLVNGILHSRETMMIILAGFISDGVMSLPLIVALMLGAGIGSTIIVQIVSFRILWLPLVFFVFGVFLHIKSSNKNVIKLGEAIIGLSFLFLGMDLFLSSIEGVAHKESFLEIIHLMESNYLFAVLISAFATLLLRSSTSVAIFIISLGLAEVIDLRLAIFLILGVNLGVSLNMIYASLRGRDIPGILSLLHFIFNLFGIVVLFVFFDEFFYFIQLTSSDNGRQIANAHTFYNIINALLILPLVPFIVNRVQKFLPQKSLPRKDLFYLERRLICTPSVSIKRVNEGVVEMASIAREMLDLSSSIFFEDKKDNLQIIDQKENRIDNMTEKLSEYIIRISQQNLTRDDAMRLYSLMHVAANIEHLCDHIVYTAEAIVGVKDDKIVFSEKASKEVFGIYGKIRIMQNLTIKALEEDNVKLANEIIQHENKVDEIVKKVNNNHLQRIESGNCNAEAGRYFSEILYNLERIGDHYDNIAYAIVDRFRHNERNK